MQMDWEVNPTSPGSEDSCLDCLEPLDNVDNSDSNLKCEICHRFVHHTCAGVSIQVANTVVNYKNLTYTCDTCVSERDFLTSIENRLSKIEKVLSSHGDLLSEHRSALSEVRSYVIKPNKNLIVQDDDQSSPNVSPKRNFSDVLKSEVTPRDWNDIMDGDKKRRRVLNVVTDKDHEPILIVKPRKQDDQVNMKSVIKSAINPLKDPVKYMRETSTGKIIIKCSDQKAVADVGEKLNKIMGAKYEIDKPKEFLPTISVIGIDKDECDYTTDKQSLIQSIRAQNSNIVSETAELEVVEVKKRERYYTAIIRTDTVTFNNIMRRGRLNISWNSCKCYENLYSFVGRCYKCCDFGHYADKCTQSEHTCPICAGSHKMDDCQNKDDKKCINCIRANAKLDLSLETNHMVWSYECPVLQKRMKTVKSRTRYKQ